MAASKADVGEPVSVPSAYDTALATPHVKEFLGIPVELAGRRVRRLELRTRKLDVSRVDEEQIRAALAATIDEVPLSGVTTVVGAFGGGPSIHRLVLLESIHPEYSIGDDGERKYHSVHRRQERRYTGPLESSSQRDYLPVLIASDALLAALPTEGLATDELEGHRELLAARFRGEFDGAPPWLRDLIS